ncbi:ABC transporter substrate-binding protein [Haloprofundus salilacus]|uniref:ABC transporter substrate-binding protein n=1 Tax=Haloprofundus salilacus TaxID=2876190 RepID=UPI001CCA0515|nr:ABC transporter substrate-binding protein [Haloprofundus salilacus]
MDSNDESRRRRTVLQAGAAMTVGALAGCLSGDAPSGAEDAASRTSEDGDTEGATDESASERSYQVTMAPMGTVEFDSVPETWVPYKSGYGDMGFALGIADGMVGIDDPEGSLQLLQERLYSQIPGFSVDTEGLTDIRSADDAIDKEVFYEIDADLHLMDPNLPRVYFEWDDGDVQEISDNVAPFFGNFIRRARDESWGEPYESYRLYEAFEKVAQVFQREERYEAFASLHDEVQASVAEALPPAEERPTIALLNGGSDPANGVFYAMDPTAEGYEMKQYRDLGIRNAFEGVETGQYGETDYETMLEVDPEIIVFHWGITYEAEAFRSRFVDPLENDTVGKELTAVKEGNLYPGGTAEQGPIINLFQTEMLAQQQYPDDFGEFPGLGEVPEETLFDRQRVADIVAGKF